MRFSNMTSFYGQRALSATKILCEDIGRCCDHFIIRRVPSETSNTASNVCRDFLVIPDLSNHCRFWYSSPIHVHTTDLTHAQIEPRYERGVCHDLRLCECIPCSSSSEMLPPERRQHEVGASSAHILILH